MAGSSEPRTDAAPGRGVTSPSGYFACTSSTWLAYLATSRIALTVGCATLIIPPALRIAADRFGIGNAYAIVAALLLAAAALAVAADRSTRK